MIIKKTDRNSAKTITECLSKNGVVIMPCDTIYGFVCTAYSPAEERIRSLKGRDGNKQFIHLIASSDYLENISADIIDDRILSLWPGPLTLIVKSLRGGTIALRVPQDDFLCRIISDLGIPLISTSVNRSGMPAMNRIDEIISSFKDEADIIVDGGSPGNNTPSTILDLTSRPYKIIRQGQCVVPAEYLG